MNLLMVSGDRSLAAGKSGAFAAMLKEFHTHFERIDIMCPRAVGARYVHVLYNNVYIHSAKGGLLAQPFFIRRKGRELASTHQYGALTVHEYPPFYNGIGARLLLRTLKIPSVLEIHHIVGWPKAASMSEWIGRVMTKVFLPSHAKKFSRVRVVNRTVKELLSAWGVSAERIEIVPSFYLDNTAVSVAAGQPKTVDVVFCARLVANKGLLETLDAVADVKDVTLLIIGDGPLRAHAETKVDALGLRSRVRFTGWLSTQTEVLQQIASGKIFIMNSRSEGGPRSALEAMALGVPVIATSVGVMPDVIIDGVNGVLTNGTANDLQWKIQSLLADTSKCESMGREARKVMERFEKVSAIKAYAEFVQSFSLS